MDNAPKTPDQPRRVRVPGHAFELTDEELLVVPMRMLSKEQRKRRRYLKNGPERERTKKRTKERRQRRRGVANIRYCRGYKKNGDPCNARAVLGAQHCRSHLTDEERVELDMPTTAELRKRAEERSQEVRRERLEARKINGATVTAPKLGRALMEVAVQKLFSRYFRAIGMEFVGIDEEGNPVVIDEGAEKGVCLYGQSKDGDIVLTDHPDLLAQIQVIEKLWDRVYGKPKQTQVLEGGSRPVQVQPVRTVERSQKVAEYLEATRNLHRPQATDNNEVSNAEVVVDETIAEVIHLHNQNEQNGDGSYEDEEDES